MYSHLVEFIEERRTVETEVMTDTEKKDWHWDENVPTAYKTHGGKALGRWINNQWVAKHKGTLKKDREARLTKIGLRMEFSVNNTFMEPCDHNIQVACSGNGMAGCSNQCDNQLPHDNRLLWWRWRERRPLPSMDQNRHHSDSQTVNSSRKDRTQYGRDSLVKMLWSWPLRISTQIPGSHYPLLKVQLSHHSNGLSFRQGCPPLSRPYFWRGITSR